MNIKAISEVVNNPFFSEDHKANEIISILAKEETSIETILKIIHEERAIKKELITNMNLELSRAHVFIESFTHPEPKLKKEAQEMGFTKSFVLEKIYEFYLKHKGLVGHCFKDLFNPQT